MKKLATEMELNSAKKELEVLEKIELDAKANVQKKIDQEEFVVDSQKPIETDDMKNEN